MNEKVGVNTKTRDAKRKSFISKKQNSDFSKTEHIPFDQTLFLQRNLGNEALQRMMESRTIQAKLKIGQPNDKYEREADHVAHQVMRMPEEGCPECMEMKEDEEDNSITQFKANTNQSPALTPGIASRIQFFKNGGQPLSESTRTFFESRFGRDFGGVRVHTGTSAAETTKLINARAFTIGKDVVFGSGQYSPGSVRGKQLLAHELTHVLQQNSVADNNRIQRQIRSPVFEEAVTQISGIEASIHGRPLGLNEEKLARSIFGKSVDYSRVSLIPTKLLIWRTVGNTIRVPKGFTIKNANMERTFIHEMTHVWQYQHGGTGYISKSLSDQIVAAAKTGSRAGAYKANVVSGKSFFEYRVEQQASIVEEYFAMVKEHSNPATKPARKTQLANKIALYKPLIAQMRAALPKREIYILNKRASEVMGTTGTRDILMQGLIPAEHRLTPIKPLLEVRIPGT